MGTGLQQIPFRIPEKWSATWYQQHLRDVLALADSRNSIGVGLTVTGDPNTLATYSVDEDIRNLVNETFVLVSLSALTPNARQISADEGVSISDNGPGALLTIGLEDHGIPYDKLAELTTFGVLGRAPHIPGGPEEIAASQDGDVLCVQSDALGFTNVPIWSGIHNWIDSIAATWGTDGDLSIVHSGTAGTITNNTGNLAVVSAGGFTVNGDTLAEIAQDAVGTILTNSATIEFTYNDSTPAISADLSAAVLESLALANSAAQPGDNVSIFVNDTGYITAAALPVGGDPSATFGVNLAGAVGSALTWLRSDAVLKLDQGISPTWTGNHTFSNTLTVGTTANASTIQAAGVFSVSNANGATADFRMQQAGSNRWIFRKSGDSETGGNAGSNFVINSRNDDGSSKANVVNITRATSEFSFSAGSGASVRLNSDNQELTVGTGNDLRLYHDGTNSNIRNDTGDLIFRSGATEVISYNASPTTGAQTATFVATNKPGSGTAGPSRWWPVKFGGITYYIPMFGA